MFEKRLMSAVLILAAALLSGGCTALFEEETTAGAEQYDIDTPSDELPQGLYLRQNGILSVPCPDFRTFSSFTEENYVEKKDSRIIWYTAEERIPVLEDEGSLIYRSDSSIPEYFVLESFEHLCDSIGIRSLSMNANGKYTIPSAASLEASSTAYACLKPYLEKGTIILDTVNGTPLNPSMINRAGAIVGLEYGKRYRIGFFIGTGYYEQDLIADTHIYASREYFRLSSYEMTKNGYLIVQFPELLTPGLYDLSAAGTFRYGGITTAVHEEDYIPSETEITDAAIQGDESETLPLSDYNDPQ